MGQKSKNNKILLAHGSGGRLMHQLIEEIFFKYFSNDILLKAGDSAVFDIDQKRLAMTTDSYVIKPIFFPDSDIGRLAICGTINDLAVSGARPLYISCGFIIEEGFGYESLEQIVSSMAATACQAAVKIIAGDVKVVEKGAVDAIFINTTGIGTVYEGCNLGIEKIRPEDKVVINGNIGEHAVAVLGAREKNLFDVDVKSDCAPLNSLIEKIISNTTSIRFMRDPTRGGLATTLNEIVKNRNYSIMLEEKNLPITEAVKSVCELLGFDALYMANEGKVVIIVSSEEADKVLEILKSDPLGKDARIIGEVLADFKGKVFLKTTLGTKRNIDMLSGQQLPRIC